MVSINNNFGIGALRATANAATANGLNDDTGKVKTLKASEQFPQPDVQKTDEPRIHRFANSDEFIDSGFKADNANLNDLVVVGKNVYVVKGQQNDDGTWDKWIEQVN